MGGSAAVDSKSFLGSIVFTQIALLGVLLIVAKKNEKPARIAFVAFDALVILSLTGCANVGNTLPKPSAAASTAPGTYTLVVTAKSGNLSHAIPFTLIVR